MMEDTFISYRIKSPSGRTVMDYDDVDRARQEAREFHNRGSRVRLFKVITSIEEIETENTS